MFNNILSNVWRSIFPQRDFPFTRIERPQVFFGPKTKNQGRIRNRILSRTRTSKAFCEDQQILSINLWYKYEEQKTFYVINKSLLSMSTFGNMQIPRILVINRLNRKPDFLLKCSLADISECRHTIWPTEKMFQKKEVEPVQSGQKYDTLKLIAHLWIPLYVRKYDFIFDKYKLYLNVIL